MRDIVKTEAQWVGLLASDNPISKLTEDAQTRFNERLKFGEDGVCTLFAGDIENAMTVRELRDFLALFGLDYDSGISMALLEPKYGDEVNIAEVKNDLGIASVPTVFLKDAYCAKKGSCKKDSSYYCTSNC